MKVIHARSEPVGSRESLNALQMPAASVLGLWSKWAIDYAKRVSIAEGRETPAAQQAIEDLRLTLGSYRVARWRGELDAESAFVFRGKTRDNLDQRGATYLAGLHGRHLSLTEGDYLRLLEASQRVLAVAEHAGTGS